MLITTLIFSFCKDGLDSVNVKLLFLVVCVRCEVLRRLVVSGNVLLQSSDKELHTKHTPLRTTILH